uniref:Sec20 C-terminal domain-containing protein n=1 Tax=Strigamia maritima TaxID=126957 RepID=T1JH73_STRMM
MDVNDVTIKTLQDEIIRHDLQIKELIQNIRRCVGPEEELDALNLSVRTQMEMCQFRIKLIAQTYNYDLERLAKEQDIEADKANLLKEVENHSQQTASMQTSLRKANVAARMAIDKLNREVLLTLPTTDVRRRKRDKEELVKTSSGITDSLFALSQLMSNQVQQSEHVLSHLVGSSKTLTENQEEFKTMGSVIQQSQKLLTKYNRRELTDKILIFFALAFFFACVLYIVKKQNKITAQAQFSFRK